MPHVYHFRNELDIAELEDSTIFVSKNFIQLVRKSENELSDKEVFGELFLECVKHLKIMCTKGSSFQNLIVNTNGMLEALKNVISSKFCNISPTHEIKCFQLIANLCVKNEWSQAKLWSSMSDLITVKFESEEKSFVNVAAMIIYNMILSKVPQVDLHKIINISLYHFSKFLKDSSESLPDFVSILMDFMICHSEEVVDIYKQLEPPNQKMFLYYVHDHVENDSSE